MSRHDLHQSHRARRRDRAHLAGAFDTHDGAEPALRNAEALRRFGDEGGERIGWNRADDLRRLAECGCGRAELD